MRFAPQEMQCSERLLAHQASIHWVLQSVSVGLNEKLTSLLRLVSNLRMQGAIFPLPRTYLWRDG